MVDPSVFGAPISPQQQMTPLAKPAIAPTPPPTRVVVTPPQQQNDSGTFDERFTGKSPFWENWRKSQNVEDQRDPINNLLQEDDKTRKHSPLEDVEREILAQKEQENERNAVAEPATPYTPNKELGDFSGRALSTMQNPGGPGSTYAGSGAEKPNYAVPQTGNAMRDAIAKVASEHGIDPRYALATAERESNFNPNAKSSKTIYGMFQMSGPLRQQYGSGDSADPSDQAAGWARSMVAMKDQLGSRLGREPTSPELYLGHHFGAGRAAQLLKTADPNEPVSDYFTPYELSINPHIVKAGTVGRLVQGTVSDMDRRMSRYGGDQATPIDPAQYGAPTTTGSDPGSYGDAPGAPESGAIDPSAYGDQL